MLQTSREAIPGTRGSAPALLRPSRVQSLAFPGAEYILGKRQGVRGAWAAGRGAARAPQPQKIQKRSEALELARPRAVDQIPSGAQREEARRGRCGVAITLERNGLPFRRGRDGSAVPW